VGTVVFLFLAPGVVAGVIPWLLTRWEVDRALWLPLRLAGGVILATSVGALLHAFARFVVEGIGTPAPVAPTERLVIGGLYRYVRNPMYLAVVGAIVGQALLLGQLTLLVYAGALWVVFFAFVHWYEEPHLALRFGADYERYREAVPGWLPRPKGLTEHPPGKR